MLPELPSPQLDCLLLRADVLRLEVQLARRTEDLQIMRDMLSAALDIAHQSLAYIAKLQADGRR